MTTNDSPAKVKRFTPKKPGEMQDIDMEKASQDCCNYVSEKTCIDYTACKAMICSMIYGLNVIGTCKRFSLSIYEVVDIRCAFDDWVEGRP